MDADLGVAASGADVIFTSCNDENHPASNIIDGNDRTFWVTTGLFPQQFIVQLQNESDFSKIKTVTTNVRGIKFDKCSEQTPSSFETFHESEIPKPQGGKIQSQTHTVASQRAKFVRVTLVSGWDDFASVHRIGIQP